ncbi:MAG: winged helix-turn-helix domain-containing protein [Sphingomonadales bacterium]|nr:winged helix-turn-helix domain-containing protein [Sphingomonadales bacterium]
MTGGVQHCPYCRQVLPEQATPWVDLETNTLWFRGKSTHFGPRQAAALKAMADRLGEFVSPIDLFECVMDRFDGSADYDNIVTAWVQSLRHKLAGTGLEIGNLRGCGYILAILPDKETTSPRSSDGL